MSSDIPSRLLTRPRDKRGYVIPFVQFVAADGTPDFRTNDAAKVEHALTFRLCGLCGVPLGRHVHFIGGPKSAESGHFYDPPMHRECAIYSLRTCPHLARSKGRYADAAPPKGATQEAKFIVGEMDVTHKAEWFGLLHSDAFTFEKTRGGMIVIHAKLPWLDVERWKDGGII